MKKLTAILALVLCLVLCVFAFASCEKKGKTTSTTAAGTAAPAPSSGDASSADATTAPVVTQAPHVCTPSDDYEVERPATCIEAGSKAKYCVECGDTIPDSSVPIPIDPEAHKINEWITVEPTLLAPDGSETGTCLLCGKEIKHELVFEPYVISSDMDSIACSDYNKEKHVDWLNNILSNGIMIKKSINAIKDEDQHYYPTDENPLGNDLLVEVSYLWNQTMDAGYSGEPLTFGHVDGYDVFNCGATVKAKIRGGFTYEYVYKKDGNETQSLGEYGWHRLGFRVHQEVEIVSEEVKYTYLVSAYVDGTLILTVDMTDYALRRNTGSTVTAFLYTAGIDENGELVCYDIGANPNSGYATSYGLLFLEDFFSATGAYCVIGDVNMTCGQEFVQNVVPNATPDDATFTLDDKGTPDDTTDDVTCPAKIWFKYAE